MKYERNEIVSNLYEVSKCRDGGSMFSVSEGGYEVYNLDRLKDVFCDHYRHGEKLKSCDAYYYDQNNHVVMEFKNTSYRKLKEYYNDIEIKMTDTHMLLAETFYSHKKNTELSKKLVLLVVYNDGLSYGKGVSQIGNALNTMKPKKGDAVRKVAVPKLFADEAAFRESVRETKDRYEGCFYKEVRFVERKDFKQDYMDTGYFGNLTEWPGMNWDWSI